MFWISWDECASDVQNYVDVNLKLKFISVIDKVLLKVKKPKVLLNILNDTNSKDISQNNNTTETEKRERLVHVNTSISNRNEFSLFFVTLITG